MTATSVEKVGEFDNQLKNKHINKLNKIEPKQMLVLPLGWLLGGLAALIIHVFVQIANSIPTRKDGSEKQLGTWKRVGPRNEMRVT